MSLAEYLDDVAEQAFRYGAHDCATLMADWLVSCGFVDPMSDRRGTYADRREYRLALKSEGGLLASCRDRFARVGLTEACEPKEGDVAVVSAPFAIRHSRLLRRPVGAIMGRDGFCTVLNWPRGLVGARLPVLAAWSVPRG